MSNIYISHVRLKGYRNIRDTETTFENGLNIIIGANGSGKTNFLWLLANIFQDETNKIGIEGDIKLENFSEIIKSPVDSISIKHQYNKNIQFDSSIKKEIIFEYIKGDPYEDLNLNILLKLGFIKLIPFKIPESIDCFTQASNTEFNSRSSLIILYSNNTPLRNHFIHSNQKFIKNTSDYTLSMFNFDKEIIEQVATYSPVQNIRIRYPLADNEIVRNENSITIRNLQYEFETNAGWFLWNELSDGTQRIVWIILSILTNMGRIILLEEPELGIHPDQLFLLMDFLKEESKRQQIILTTHAPEALNILEPHELNHIRIAKYDTDLKTTVLQPIAERTQVLARKYMEEVGSLSRYWLHINLENNKK